MSLRTGGREAVEDTPVTGATEEQIRNAKELIYVNVPINQELTVRKSVDVVARYLVPVGYVIVRAEDALPDYVRDSMQRIVDQHRIEMSASGEDFLDVSNWLAAGGQA